MSPRLRKFVLSVHLTTSLGWMGAVAAYVALDVTAAISQDAQLVRAAYIAMGLIVGFVIVPLALASLLTGIVQSLGTTWGLFRHYWVLVSLVLTLFATIILLVEAQTVGYMAGVAASGADPRELPGSLLHSIGGLVMLLTITVLNIYKPRGLTRYGWRKQQEQRREQRGRRTTGVR